MAGAQMNTAAQTKLSGSGDAHGEFDIDRLLQDMFDAAIATAQPALRVPQFLPAPPRGRTVVIGAGKASAAMAKALEDHWQGDLEGLVVTRDGYAVACRRIEIVEAAHPVPDESGLQAAQRMLQLVSGLTADDLVICSTCADALAVLRRYEICAAPAAIALLESGSTETLKPDDARLTNIETHLIATPQLALEAAAEKSRAAGIEVHILSDATSRRARHLSVRAPGKQ